MNKAKVNLLKLKLQLLLVDVKKITAKQNRILTLIIHMKKLIQIGYEHSFNWQ